MYVVGMTGPKWLVLTWRLPAASSTARVATWRNLQRLGAISLTPGAVIVPFSEDLLEQLEWIAEDIVQRDGDAYVLPVTELPALERGLARATARDYFASTARGRAERAIRLARKRKER